MNILLINPRATYADEHAQKCYPPMHLLYLAAAAQAEGLSVAVMDAHAFRLSDEEIVRRAVAAQPALIGLSLYSEILPHVHALTVLLREALPGVVMVLGGPHATAVPEDTLQQFPVDYVLTGEAEYSLPMLARADAADQTDLEAIPGLYWRRGSEVVHGAAYQLPDVCTVPRPDRSLVQDAYDQGLYHTILVRQRPVDTIFTSRGCPFDCGFCYNFRRTYRARTPEDILDEIGGIRERGIRDIEICDDTFSVNRDRAMMVFDLLIKADLGVQFRIKSRVDVFDAEMARRAAEAGVYQVSFGMESGSQRVLDAMEKGTTVEQNASACQVCRDHGLWCHASWVVGYPGETAETIEQTRSFIRESDPTTSNVSVLRPYPHTSVYRAARKDGTLVGDWSPSMTQYPWVRLPWAPQRELIEQQAKALQRHIYLRPKVMGRFAGIIFRNMNVRLTAYAWQELRRL